MNCLPSSYMSCIYREWGGRVTNFSFLKERNPQLIVRSFETKSAKVEEREERNARMLT